MTDPFQGLMEIASSFRQAQMLLTAVGLKLFDHMEKPASAGDVAKAAGTEPRATEILLNGLVSLGLIKKKGGLFSNGEAVSATLVHRKAGYRGAIFMHTANYWAGWSALPDIVRKGHPEESRQSRDPDEHRSFILGMHAIARDIAPRVAQLLPLPENGKAVDIGGGPGTYCMAFAQARPGLHCTLFDLPETIPVARENIAAAGREIVRRIGFREGDFLTGPVGDKEFDFAWLSQILHAYSEEECGVIASRAFEALKPGGAVAIHEFALNDAKTAPQAAAIFSVHMLAMTGGGRAYSKKELAGFLAGAGFKSVQVKRASPRTSLVIGRKP
jgi:ubiquinone/menaquinone biosynthesis C-methylase UbiE